MKICIIGYSGFLGSHFLKHFSKKFKVLKINLRKLPDYKSKEFKKFLDKIVKSNIIINCAASLNPKTKRDFFINQDFPYILQNYIKKKKIKTFLIHFSTINVLIKNRKDPYTISKKIAEKRLINTDTIILRLPLLFNEKNGIIKKEGNLVKIHDYLKFKFFPIYPMIYPGHLYQPLNVKKILIFTENIILKKKKSKMVYNIVGREKKYLWDFYNHIASAKKKRF